MICTVLKVEEDYYIGKFVISFKSKKKIKKGNSKENFNIMKSMKMLKILKLNQLFSHQLLNKKPEK